MEIFTFSGLGTTWSISIDGEALRDEVKTAILKHVATFESRLSRFLPQSEANAFRDKEAGVYPVSEEFSLLLTRGDVLRKITEGVYDPGFGRLLEHAGYDKEYRLHPDNQVEDFRLPQWTLAQGKLTIDGPVVFDFGGIGKGYCIDTVANVLRSFGYEHFLVEGGGDMYGTSKKDGSGFHIALEWPGKPETAFGTIELKDQGVAVSDSSRRRWGQWHHIIDPTTKKPIETIVGCAAVAKSAFDADCMTSGLFLSHEEKYPLLADTFSASFVVFKNDGTVQVSSNWQGELF